MHANCTYQPFWSTLGPGEYLRSLKKIGDSAHALIENVYRYTIGTLLPGAPVKDKFGETASGQEKITSEIVSSYNGDDIVRTTTSDTETGEVKSILAEIIYNQSEYGITFDRIAYQIEMKETLSGKIRRLFNSLGYHGLDIFLKRYSTDLVLSIARGTYAMLDPKILEEVKETVTINYDDKAVYQAKYFAHSSDGNHHYLSHTSVVDVPARKIAMTRELLKSIDYFF